MKKILSIITKINEKYPDITQNEIMDILNNKEEVDTSILRELV